MPTIKQKLAFKEVVNGSTITKAMKLAGYSVETSKRTNKLTSTVGWEELMEQHLPDKLLAKKHKELLNKTEKIVVNDGKDLGSHIEDTGQPHSDATRALDLAYKLKGRYVSEENGGNKTLIINIIPETATRYAIPPSTEDKAQ